MTEQTYMTKNICIWCKKNMLNSLNKYNGNYIHKHCENEVFSDGLRFKKFKEKLKQLEKETK